ncbi:hypothetical protein RHMOL_Rhmol12G0143200 [Rhododendron molle]|uniref:Uncharacterized protein n=1 Tax=Rhododendron molle TaxID=49168 RepID=A0ACC0LIE7_RHOML|nr:hypothetical protein RHMOL_Rhmol12G0143200 [Rhododendron molle]
MYRFDRKVSDLRFPLSVGSTATPLLLFQIPGLLFVAVESVVLLVEMTPGAIPDFGSELGHGVHRKEREIT